MFVSKHCLEQLTCAPRLLFQSPFLLLADCFVALMKPPRVASRTRLHPGSPRLRLPPCPPPFFPVCGFLGVTVPSSPAPALAHELAPAPSLQPPTPVPAPVHLPSHPVPLPSHPVPLPSSPAPQVLHPCTQPSLPPLPHATRPAYCVCSVQLAPPLSLSPAIIR